MSTGDNFNRVRRFGRFCRDERGTSTVEWLGLTVVMVVLLIAVVGYVSAGDGQIGQAVLDGWEESILSLQGGGASVGTADVPNGQPSEASLPGLALPSVGISELVASGTNPGEASAGEESGGGGFLGQVGGFFAGVWEGAVDTVTGVATLIWDGVRLSPITGDIYGFFDPEGRAEVQERYAALIEAFADDPLGTTGDMLYAIVEPIVTDWNEGRYGEAIGRSVFEVALFFVPGDEVRYVGVAGRIDRMMPDELIELLARTDRLTPDELAALMARLDNMTPEEMADLLRQLDQMTPEELARLGFDCSFTADTLVTTIKGLKAISEVSAGEYVLAYDAMTKALAYYPVTAVWMHTDTVLTSVTLNGETIETTPDHPFYTAEGEWVTAGELRMRQGVLQADGDSGVVQAVRSVHVPQPMYNLSVAKAHTYFVGEGQWLVHNACRFALIYERLNQMTPDEFAEMLEHLDDLSPEQLRALTNYRGRWENFFDRRPYLDEHGSYNIHHGFPRDFREFFYERGIDIDNPQYMFELPESLHTRLPDGVHTGPYPESWNGRWEEWIRSHPNATREEIFAHLDQLSREFNLEDYLGQAPRVAPPNVPPRLEN